jgi:hypothetical protein
LLKSHARGTCTIQWGSTFSLQNNVDFVHQWKNRFHLMPQEIIVKVSVDVQHYW